MEILEILDVLIIAVLKLFDEIYFVFQIRLDFIFKHDIILNLLVNSKKPISCKVRLFKEQSEAFIFRFSNFVVV